GGRWMDVCLLRLFRLARDGRTSALAGGLSVAAATAVARGNLCAIQWEHRTSNTERATSNRQTAGDRAGIVLHRAGGASAHSDLFIWRCGALHHLPRTVVAIDQAACSNRYWDRPGKFRALSDAAADCPQHARSAARSARQ